MSRETGMTSKALYRPFLVRTIVQNPFDGLNTDVPLLGADALAIPKWKQFLSLIETSQ